VVNYYPIFLDLRAKPVLVVGGGKVALRKTKGLLEAGARITIIAPNVSDELRGRDVTLIEREYQSGDCNGHALIFAATSSREVNAQIGREASALGIPANIADAPEECGFIVPARFADGDVQIAVSTGGKDPRRAVAVRDRIRDLVGL
jgi:precorrin-2 dehydrogenase/sirohydrochlorin ferrochelatase